MCSARFFTSSSASVTPAGRELAGAMPADGPAAPTMAERCSCALLRAASARWAASSARLRLASCISDAFCGSVTNMDRTDGCLRPSSAMARSAAEFAGGTAPGSSDMLLAAASAAACRASLSDPASSFLSASVCPRGAALFRGLGASTAARAAAALASASAFSLDSRIALSSASAAARSVALRSSSARLEASMAACSSSSVGSLPGVGAASWICSDMARTISSSACSWRRRAASTSSSPKWTPLASSMDNCTARWSCFS
mmetsp:Transcript_838/g.2318  ORF Transcript_838/g.2318 Transcript_838/m.2318 type:complete len:259 (+) Transcript_838:606-1382(+)